MSVKCNYSDKYYPLLETWKLHPETFESNVREFFANAEEVLNGSVVQNNTPLRSMEVKGASYNPGLEVSTDVKSVDQFYINAPSKYRQMSNAFMRRVVESAIYNPKTETLIDANQLIGDVSYLNQAILDYKTSLLSTIANYLNANGISYNGSPNDLEAIQDFVLQNYIPSIDNIEVYNAYVIITNFDKLLSLHAPFIKVTPEYTKSSQYHPKRYTYIGAEVKHYTGVMSTDEFMSAENNTSEIVKILLQYFQEVDENDHPIEGTSINLGGFNSAMSKVFAWAQTNEKARKILANDSNADFGEIIDMYLDSIKDKKVKNAHITYLTDKLRGIKHYIYSGKIPKELTTVFTHLVEKTVPSSYIQYDIVGSDATVKYLTERSVLLQRTFLNECIDTAAEYWKNNKELYQRILQDKGYSIKVHQSHSDTYIVSINGQNISITEGMRGHVQVTGDIDKMTDIIADIAQLFISEDTERIGQQLYKGTSLTKLYAPIIASIIIKSQVNQDFNVPFGPIQDLARVLSVLHGSDVINVVKNGEGNNLPLYQMLCLSYRHRDIHKRLLEDQNKRNIQTPYFYNIAYNNIDHIHAPQIRAGVLAKDGTYKTAASLSADEVMHLAILHDFYDNLTNAYTLDENSRQRSGIVGFQSHVYADKNKHFIQMFDLSAEWVLGYDDSGNKITINPSELLKAYLNGSHDDLEPLVQAFYYSGKNQIDTIIENILDDYRKVFPEETFESLKDVERKIIQYGKKVDELRKAFIDQGINFVEEIHISKSGVNESIIYLQKQFESLDSTRNFLNSQFKQFKEDAKGAIKTIEKALESRKNAPNIDRLLHAYFLSDVLFTNDYNRMMVGQVFAHSQKNNRTISDIKIELGWHSAKSETRKAEIEQQAKEIWESETYATRWISQVKRMVIYGATYHSYAQGLKYGVPEFIKTAVFEDIPSNVFSITGDSDKVDSMDGSGWTSPIFSRLQNYSLLDAAVGANKKTIYHDIESKFGVPTLLKWAEYEITNEKRRNSHTTALENLYRRMHNLQFDSSISFEYVPENLYYTDNKGNYYEIDAIEVKNGIGYMYRTRVQPNGKRIEVVEPISIQVNTIYDIDQLLGGAWAMSKEDDRLVFTESNMDILTKIVCENNLKGYMIGWAVNKSGMKVGVTNLNTVDTWNNDEELRYITLSTRFGGLQMNADHELDHAEVTEMTQMISALEQMGVMHDVVTNIYREIGKFCYDSIADIATAAYSETDKDKLYQIYGRAMIEAFNSGNKDTLGLAQSFISIAQRSIQDNKITYQIPFSSASINGIFNSTVTSQLIKKSIRRHYSGVAAVLNPSFNVIEYYTINGLQYRKEELYSVIKETLDARGLTYLLDLYNVEDFINEIGFNVNGTIVNNPFIHEATRAMQNLDGTVRFSNDQIDFEDTIIIVNETYDEEGNIKTTLSDPIKIDTFEKYDMIKHDPRRKLIHTLHPRNLKGANTTFTINGETKSIFESPYTIILKYFNSSSATDAETFESELETIFTNEYAKIFDVKDNYASALAKNHMVIMNYLIEAFKAKTGLNGYTHPSMFKHYLIQQQQALLNAIADGNPFDWFEETVTATDVKVHGAQIGMGKLFAKQFGLRKGDSLAQIKKEGPEFFYHRIQENFTVSNNDLETYDCVLYDGQGAKLHVKILPRDQWSKFKTDTSLYRNEEYVTVDNVIYHNGEELFAGEGKEIYTYVDSQNNASDLIIIDSIDRLQELINDGDYIYTYYNYTTDNYRELLQFKYKSEDFKVVIGINPNTGKTQWRSITNAELSTFDIQELIDILSIHETKSIHHRIGTWAEEKYENFLKSLNFVGTRIPCQNMTSFAPMEVIMFSDVEANEIYLPTTITWLEGSDYDIDKTYLLGFSVANNGKIYTDGSSKRYRGDRLRNTVVNGIMDVIKNPRTQINLTNPLSMEHMQDLSSKSILGKAARRMTSFNPACKYMMQIENMVGKGVIGNVATAIKSFFALSTVYNEAYSNIYKELINGNFEAVRSLLNKYSFKQNGRYRTLANVNMELFMNINWDTIPEDIKIPLLEIIEWQAGLSDQSLMLAELLNAATDNAKELILKKINADTNWVDIYTSAFMLGEDLSDIGDFMISPEITELINKFTTNIFDPTNVGTKTMFIEQAIKDADTEHKKALYTELLERVNISEELRILGKILKINQGMPTKTLDLYEYINSIESFIEGRLNVDLINQYKQALNNLQEAIGDDENPNWNDPKLKAALTIYKSAKEAMQTSYIRFNFINFLQNSDYQDQIVNQYESVKVKFNILDALVLSPHFSQMQKVLALNTTILNALSKRNDIESKVWRFAQHKNAKGKPALLGSLNTTERETLKKLTEQTLIHEWISIGLDGMYVEYGSQRFDFNSGFDPNKFKIFVESIIIPLLKYNMLKTPNGDTIPTRDNEFIKKLTFGKHNGVSIYKLPFNMTEIDSDESTRLEYEKILNAFGDLRNITLHGGLNITDIFYLYNLIVHNDHFGRNSLTRLFEDLISSKDGEKLIVFKFNEWLETVNEQEIIDKVLGNWGAVHSNGNIENSNATSSSLVITPKFAADKKATIKARISNKFIGFGPEGGSTYYYAQQAGSSANTGDYTAKDVIFVSVPGKRGDAQIRKQYQDQTIREAIKALKTGATLITDSAEYLATSDYNEGERRLAQNLQYLGYQYETIVVDGYQIGKWTNPKNIETTSKSESKTVKYTPKGQVEQTYTIVGNKIYNKKGEEVHTTDSKHRRRIFANLALSEGRAVIISYNGIDYIINNRNQILSTRTNDIMQWPDNHGDRIAILEKAKEEFAKLSNQSSPRVEIYQGYWTREEVESQIDKVFLFGDNTDDRVNTHYVPSRTQAVIRGLDNAIGIDTKKNRGTSEGWGRYSTNNYEVSSAGDIRFSAKYARFKDGTIIFGHDVSNRTIESVYQNGIKQGDWTTDSNTKTGIPRSKEIIKGNTEDASYYEGYLPLWQEWAKQNPQLIEELREKSAGKILTDKFANTRVSQARALSDIIKNGSYFTDADFDSFKTQVDEAIQRAINSGKTIVIPADGIGTGKAELEKRAPKLFAYLQQKLDELKNLSSSNPTQLSFDFGENDDPERFNTTEESIAVLESPKTILSNSELQLWSHVTNPKILVASEYSDPAFHTKKILEVINGTRNVTDWKDDNFTGSQFDGLYIITKHDGLPIRKLLETKIPKLIHFSITTLGGTKYEPGVMKYNDLLDRIAEYIKLGLDPNTITIRIDPIVPGETKWEDIETVMRRSAEMGIKRIKFSIMDAYPNTIKAMTELGYNFETYYETKTNFTVNRQYQFHAKAAVQKDFATRMLQLAQKYNLELHTCAEPLVLPGILHEGCLSVNAVNEMLGTHIEDKGYDNNKYRQLCSCFGGKIDVLKYDDHCSSHCIYCYAKHENDRAMQYYNEDGTLKRNAFTDIYWDGQYNIEDISEESVAEEPVTIGFDNSTDRTDDAEIIEEVVEPETKSGIVLNTEQQTAVDGIVAHINSGNLEPVLLNGKAGTGKTTIISEILKQVDPNHKVWVGAVTHKASAVLFNKLQGLPQFITKKTVASMTDKKFDLSTGEFSEKSSWAQDPAAIPSIIFVDEASMVTKDDFVKITEFAKNNGVILIFIGDDGQLPPVEKSGEKSKIFALPNRYNLVERVRQGEESPILPYADGYWNYSHNKGAYPSTNPKDVITRQGAIVFSPGSILRSDNTLALFKKAVQLNKLNSVKVITWTNEVRQNVNHFIHSSLFGKEKWYEGEFIIFNDTLRKGKEIIAENSSEWVIESIGDAQEYTGAFDDYSVTCKIRFATITDGDRTVMVKLFATDLDKASWTEYWNNKLVEVRKIYSQNPKKYNRVLAKIYANLQEMANVDYAYAITCHKSQGSTYDSVFVTSEIHSNQDNELKAQWLYTAITRARNVVTMIHGDGKFTGDVGELNDDIENNRIRTADTGAIPAADYVESSPNQLSLFSDDSFHIDTEYIAEREKILRNAPRNSEGQLLAPNGKVSKLTEEQWVTVRTKAFKEWFGDWINPYNANINISLDIDMESADTDGFGSRVAIILKDKNNPLQGEFIGSIPMQQQIKSIKYFKFTQYVDINSVAGSSYIEEEFRGKGFGKAAYWELGMWLSRNGSILRSAKDSSRTEAATRVWKSLERDGFAKKVEDRYEFVNNSSKVIDAETGEPKVVYHHTDNPNLTEFSTDFPNYFSQSKGGTKKAIFFDENTSGTLGRKYDIPVFLNIRNLTTYVGTKEDLHKKGTDYTTVVNESAARDVRFGGLHMSKFDDNKLINQDVWIMHNEHNVKSATGAYEFTSSPNIYDADSTLVYQTTPSKQSKLIEVVRQANEKGVKGIHIVSQSDLVNEEIYIRSAKGFVRNGEIYINVDRAGDDTVIHEFGHLYLADAKVNNREKYYELLEKVRQTKLWSDMKTWKAYANKIGSDFDEEVLATMIGDYYKSEFGIDYEYTDLVKEALSLVDGGFIDLINSEILPDLGDTFITNYALQQKVATIKGRLVSDNILKENCQ